MIIRHDQNVQEGIVDNVSVICEIGDLDMYQVDRSKLAWQEIIRKGSHLIVDLSETTYFEAYSFWALARCQKQAADNHVKFGVVPSHSVNRLLNLLPSELEQIFPVFSSREEAIRIFATTAT